MALAASALGANADMHSPSMVIVKLTYMEIRM